ncbi:hypothetical protein LA345_13185 [Burkholderia vietnamiensis]|uniref:Uncharacterized protein n=1 Tax=Burkholderia vietnamiensis (strain G4 / LMG 22486) TaxID=269482 RepID=A4JFQ4_BURVG|nr:hypothetical protein Bcep1808_2105 [Burkholderia vietnamiensis G4]MCB4344867.1 hypothetical protein [Burkholderia vietnamiensis]
MNANDMIKPSASAPANGAPVANTGTGRMTREDRIEQQIELLQRALRGETRRDEPPGIFEGIVPNAFKLLSDALESLLDGRALGERKRKACHALERLVAPIPVPPIGFSAAGAPLPRAVAEGFVASAAAGDLQKVRRWLAAFDSRALCTSLADLGVWLHDASDYGWFARKMPPRTALFAAIRARQSEMVRLLLPFSDLFQTIPPQALPDTLVWRNRPLIAQTDPITAFEEAIRLVRDESIPPGPLVLDEIHAAIAERRQQARSTRDEVLRHAESLPRTPEAIHGWTNALFAAAIEDDERLASWAAAHADKTRARWLWAAGKRANALEAAACNEAASVARILSAAPACARQSSALRIALQQHSWAIVDVLVEQALSNLDRQPTRGAARRAQLCLRLVQAEAKNGKHGGEAARRVIRNLAHSLAAAIERAEMLSALLVDGSRPPARDRATRSPMRC